MHMYAHVRPWVYNYVGVQIFYGRTLHYQISVGVWLLTPRYFSSQHALIPYLMFINFEENFNPIQDYLCNTSFSDMFAFKMHEKSSWMGVSC